MAYNPNIPNPGDLLSDSQSQLKNNFQALDNIFAKDHFEFSDSTANKGFHKQVRLVNQAAPGLAGASGALYAILYDGNSWPIWENALGSTFLATSATQGSANGYASLPGGVLVQWGFKAQTSTGTGTVTFATSNKSFITNCFMVITDAVYASNVATPNGTATVIIDSFTKSNLGFDYKMFTSSADIKGFYWIAIGN